MGKIVFVELLDKRGHVRQRHKLDSLPATIGRAYRNSVIIDDKHVCPEHLRVFIDEKGYIVIEDLKSVNGTCLISSPARVSSHIIPPEKEAELRIGDTRLRFRSDDYAVGPAEAKSLSDGVMQRLFERQGIAFLIFLLCFGIFVFNFFLESHERNLGKDLMGGSLIMLILLMLWAGFWSVLNRVTAHAFNFVSHLSLAAVAATAMLVSGSINEYYAFLFSAELSYEIIGYLLFGLILSLLLFGHFSMMHTSSLRKRIISSALAGCSIIGVIGIIAFLSQSEFSNHPSYSAKLKPVGHQWIRTETPEMFLGGLDRLRKDVDNMVEKEKSKRKKTE